MIDSQNCFSFAKDHHTAVVLNELRYKGFASWGTVSLIALMMAKSSYVSSGRLIKTYLAFSVIVMLSLTLILLIKFVF